MSDREDLHLDAEPPDRSHEVGGEAKDAAHEAVTTPAAGFDDLEAREDQSEDPPWAVLATCVVAGIVALLSVVAFRGEEPASDPVVASAVIDQQTRPFALARETAFPAGAVVQRADGTVDHIAIGGAVEQIWGSDNEPVVAIDAAGHLVVIADASGSVHVHNLAAAENGRERSRIWNGLDDRDDALDVAIDGSLIAFTLDNGHAFVHDMAEQDGQQRRRIWKGDGDRPAAVEVSVHAGRVGFIVGNGNVYVHNENVSAGSGEQLTRVWTAATRPAAVAVDSAATGVVFALDNGAARLMPFDDEVAGEQIVWRGGNDRPAVTGVAANEVAIVFTLDNGNVRLHDPSAAEGARGSVAWNAADRAAGTSVGAGSDVTFFTLDNGNTRVLPLDGQHESGALLNGVTDMSRAAEHVTGVE